MENILESVYPPEEIFVSNPRFEHDQPRLTVTCKVPRSQGYTKKPIPYVTAENYVRIMSQTSYLLAHHVIAARMIPLKLAVTPVEFLLAMEEFRLYYRTFNMIFHEKVSRGTPFEMELILKNFREIKRLGDFIIFTFSNKRTVISGEMSFIYAG